MEMELASDPAVVSLAAAVAVLAAVAVATVRGWIRLYGPAYAAGVVVGSLLATHAFVLYADDDPELARARKAQAAAAGDAAAAATATESWPLLVLLSGCALGCVLVALFRCCVDASAGSSSRKGRRMVPHVPGGRRTAPAASGWRAVAEAVLFLASVCACLCCFPSGSRHYAAVAYGQGRRGPCSAGVACDYPRS